MSFNQYEAAFREKAKKSGFSEENIVACLNYAKPLIENKIPVIYNTSHLAALVGYKTNYLKKAALFPKYYYRKFKIRKSNGSLREIVEPLPSLKEIQDWILCDILNSIPVSKFAKAYVKKRTIIDNVKYHKGREFILTLDIKDFFGSIRRYEVEKIFSNIGYSSNISNLLSKLCSYNEVLPQGASTSPYLSNLYLRDFDKVISEYCIERNLRYTRYADDLTFSGGNEILDIIKFTETQLRKLNLFLNPDKTRLMGKNQRQIVTGIVVNEVLQVSKEVRNKIRNEMYYINKFGLENHLQQINNKKSNYLFHLLGRVNFALYINPSDSELKQYRLQLESLVES